MTADPAPTKEDEAGAAVVCAGAAAIVAIVAGPDGKPAIQEIIKILQQIPQ